MNYFAIDLGATSGRTMLCRIDDGKISIEEVSRFANPIIEVRNHCYWDILHLYNEIISGLATVARQGIEIDSIGIDTWGVDFVCFGSDGDILSAPLSYRDPHTAGIPAEFFKEIPASRVYGKTGIQVMDFNSLFQLYAMHKAGNSALAAADKILFMPDALSYLLTGVMVTEYSIASTSQLLNPVTKELDDELLHGLTAAELLGGVGHVDLHVLGELVDQHVPLVPQLQRVVAVDLVLADGGVQVSDVGEDAVDLGNVLLIGRHVILIDLLQAAGVGVELLGQGVRRGAHLNVVQAVAGLVGKLTELGHKVGELGLDDAEGVVAVAHLVQHRLNVLQAA